MTISILVVISFFVLLSIFLLINKNKKKNIIPPPPTTLLPLEYLVDRRIVCATGEEQVVAMYISFNTTFTPTVGSWYRPASGACEFAYRVSNATGGRFSFGSTPCDTVTYATGLLACGCDPTPTPEPEVPIVNEFCYAHEVVVTNSIDTICTSEFFVTVYNLTPNACDEPCQFFLSEEKCKRNVPSWNPEYTYVRCGAKYSYVNSEGRADNFIECVF